MFPILIIGNFLSKHTGAFGVCEDLADHLVSRGWKILTSSDTKNKYARHLDQLWTIFSKKNQYDIVTLDVFSGLSFFWTELCVLALQMIDKPFILVLHGGNLPKLALRLPKRMRRLLASGNAVVTPSNYLAENLKSFRPDIEIIPNGIDISRYIYKKRNNPEPKLVWLRAFHRIYNPLMAINVIFLLSQKIPSITLRMGGGDSGDGSLSETKLLAEKLGISGKVEFSGKILKGDVPTWLQKGDIFVNTTMVDNTPVSILEAMACGLCIVSTNVGGIPYMLTNEEDALLVPQNDPDMMARAIERLFSTESGLATSISKNARRKIEKYDWGVIIPQWEELFLQVFQRAHNKNSLQIRDTNTR